MSPEGPFHLVRDDTEQILSLVEKRERIVSVHRVLTMLESCIISVIGRDDGDIEINDAVGRGGLECIRDYKIRVMPNDLADRMRIVAHLTLGTGKLSLYNGFHHKTGERSLFTSVIKTYRLVPSRDSLLLESSRSTLESMMRDYYANNKRLAAWQSIRVDHSLAQHLIQDMDVSARLAWALLDHYIDMRRSTLWALHQALLFGATHTEADGFGFGASVVEEDRAMKLLKREEGVMRLVQSREWKKLEEKKE